ncbi:MAG: hypothetical protein E7324_01440 [Clostridiales bacterium]|nr:hypothetical protein [Clostridiales bacterium]
MNIIRLNQTSPDFYMLMGPVFGSRQVEKDTKDRFYDDPGKQWYLIPGKGAASVKDGVLRNFWTREEKDAQTLIEAMLQDYPALTGVAPLCYRDAFYRAGFLTVLYRKNFVEVSRYEAD